jgi:hypothetical protein
LLDETVHVPLQPTIKNQNSPFLPHTLPSALDSPLRGERQRQQRLLLHLVRFC